MRAQTRVLAQGTGPGAPPDSGCGPPAKAALAVLSPHEPFRSVILLHGFSTFGSSFSETSKLIPSFINSQTHGSLD